MAPEDEVIRGNQAKTILADPLYKESWEAIEKRLVSLLRQVDIDPDKEKRVLFTLKGLNLARSHMESVMQSGKMAAEQIERDKSVGDRVKDWLS